MRKYKFQKGFSTGRSRELDSQPVTPERLKGDPFQDFKASREEEKAVVHYVDTNHYTVDVFTASGKYLSSLPWAGTTQDSDSVAGEITVPKIGQKFYVSYKHGVPELLNQVVREPALNPKTQKLKSVQSVGSKHISKLKDLNKNTKGPDFRKGRPDDLLAGDWLRLGSEGNLVGVLEGGVSVLKGGELSQVIASKVGDLLRLVGRNTDLLSDFGEIKFKNEDGRTSMTLEGGSQQTTESSPHKQNYTIKASLGAAGDTVSFKILKPDGELAHKYHISPTGQVTTVSQSDQKTIKENQHTWVGGEETKKVGGDSTTEVDGNASTHTAGSEEKTVGGSFSQRSLQGNFNITSGQEFHLTSLRKSTETVGGDVESPTPGSVAKTTTISNGSWLVDIGNPTAGSSPSARSGFKVKTREGNIELNTDVGKVQLKSKRPDSVLLGGQRPLFHAVLFEALEQYLQAFGTRIDLHTHPTAAGPTLPPDIPIYRTTQAGIPFMKSRYVTLGG